MKFKNGILLRGDIAIDNQLRHLVGLSTEIKWATEIADELSVKLFGIEIVITSAGGESHAKKSKHYGSFRDGHWWIDAVDLRTFHYTTEQGDRLIEELNTLLGPKYFINDERKTKKHIHIQFNN